MKAFWRSENLNTVDFNSASHKARETENQAGFTLPFFDATAIKPPNLIIRSAEDFSQNLTTFPIVLW